MKSFITAIVLVLGLTTSISAQKFGYINSQELLGQLPEVKESTANIETLKKQLQKKGQDQFEQSSQQKIYEKTELLLSPIQEKINNAIKEVAEDNGYTYIFDASLGMVLYADPGADVSSLVKAKLGI